MTTTNTSITVTLLGVTSGEPRTALPADTLCVGVARFERHYAAAHGAAGGYPTDMSTSAAWAGPDSAEAHEALCAELVEEAMILANADEGRDCYVLVEGAGGDGEDMWCKARVEPSVLVSTDNGNSTTRVTDDATAAAFIARYGERNVVTALRDADLSTEDYDGALALLAALAKAHGSKAIPTLP